MQPNCWVVYFPHPSQVCYHWLQVVEKIKELNLMTENWLCVMKKLGGKHYCPPWQKCWGDASPRPPQVCYHWLQAVEKIKELILMTEDWLCVMQKLRGRDK